MNKIREHNIKTEHDVLLEVKNLTTEFTINKVVVHAVNDISFSIRSGEIVGLVGETGAGKTTTAKSILNLVPNPPGKIINGEIVFEGTDLLKLSKKEIQKVRGEKITMVFQDPMTALNPMQTVGEQIMEVIRLHSHCSRVDAAVRAEEMLELVGIPGARRKQYPHEFSGGMKQRVVIAMALACNPALLIADEPTTALDVTIQAQVLDLIRNLQKKFNTSMLLITHDLGVVAEICSRVMIIYAGEIIEEGTLDDIYNKTAHPYTKGLFECIPDIENKTERLSVIKGMMPDPSDLPPGCKFCSRCKYKMPICEEEKPMKHRIGEQHQVCCHLFDK